MCRSPDPDHAPFRKDFSSAGRDLLWSINGVLSPILFCFYINSLLHSLAESGVGCFIGRVFVGALVYADDIVLLSPTASGMRTLLHVCDVFANDFSVVFNAAKSKCLWFRTRRISASYYNKKLSYRRGTARCVVSIEILPIATQQCRNYLYDKS